MRHTSPDVADRQTRAAFCTVVKKEAVLAGFSMNDENLPVVRLSFGQRLLYWPHPVQWAGLHVLMPMNAPPLV